MKPVLLVVLISCCSSPCWGQQYQGNWDSLRSYEVPEWYKDAKFGIWPHWGVYSVPAYRGDSAAEWYGRFMHCVEKGPANHPKKNDPEVIINAHYDSRGLKTAKHHREAYGTPAEFGYHDFVEQWKAEKFDADEWAQLAVDSGAKFFCMMAQHHDSFSLYDSAHTEWDSVDKGPKRDLCREMKEAVKKRGLKFGLSNHMAWNSTFFAFYHTNGFADLPSHKQYRDLYSDGVVDDDYIDRWWKRTTESVDLLEPDLYYFDWGWNTGRLADEGYHQKFASYFYNKAIEQGRGSFGSPGVVMCSKDHDDPVGSVVRDLERGRMGSIQSNVWQTDTSISIHSWGYSADDEYHSPDYLIDSLVDIVSKNGVLMLNFGPRADGTVPEQYKSRLLAMGKWLKVCGEAVYATRPFVAYGEDPNPSQQARGAVKLRYTRSKDNQTLYAVALEWPGERCTLPRLARDKFDAGQLKKVRLIGSDAELKWQQDESGLHIDLPQRPDYGYAYPLRLDFDSDLAEFVK